MFNGLGSLRDLSFPPCRVHWVGPATHRVCSPVGPLANSSRRSRPYTPRSWANTRTVAHLETHVMPGRAVRRWAAGTPPRHVRIHVRVHGGEGRFRSSPARDWHMNPYIKLGVVVLGVCLGRQSYGSPHTVIEFGRVTFRLDSSCSDVSGTGIVTLDVQGG